MFVIRHKQSWLFVAPVGSSKQYVANLSSARTFFTKDHAAAECCGLEEPIPYPTRRTRPHVITAQHVVDYFRESGQRDVCLMIQRAIEDLAKPK